MYSFDRDERRSFQISAVNCRPLALADPHFVFSSGTWKHKGKCQGPHKKNLWLLITRQVPNMVLPYGIGCCCHLSEQQKQIKGSHFWLRVRDENTLCKNCIRHGGFCIYDESNYPGSSWSNYGCFIIISLIWEWIAAPGQVPVKVWARLVCASCGCFTLVGSDNDKM